MRKTIYILSIVAIIIGCNNPKSANDENFSKSIQAHLDSEFPSCFYVGNFPVKKRAHSFSLSHDFKKLEILEEAGLVDFEKKVVEKRSNWTGKKEEVDVTEYHLTDRGKQVYNPNAKEASKEENVGGFCIGKPQITGITNFSEPSEMMGYTVSNVKFKYQVGQIPDWAKSKILINGFSKIKQFVDSKSQNITDKAVLILTEEGWVHEKLFREQQRNG